MRKKLSSKVIGAERKRRNKEEEDIFAALESNELKPVCGLSGCAYRIGWAKAQAQWESDRLERVENDYRLQLERMAAYCDSVPPFARSVLRYYIGEGNERRRTVEETAEAFGIDADAIEFIVSAAIEITKAVKIHAQWMADRIEVLQEKISSNNKLAAEQVAWDVSSVLIAKEMVRGNSK